MHAIIEQKVIGEGVEYEKDAVSGILEAFITSMTHYYYILKTALT